MPTTSLSLLRSNTTPPAVVRQSWADNVEDSVGWEFAKKSIRQPILPHRQHATRDPKPRDENPFTQLPQEDVPVHASPVAQGPDHSPVASSQPSLSLPVAVPAKKTASRKRKAIPASEP